MLESTMPKDLRNLFLDDFTLSILTLFKLAISLMLRFALISAQSRNSF